MLHLCSARNFIFYNWATAGRGKTAALKAALSVWGDPNRLMISFNATSVALERRAAFSCDLPFGIDERQSASRQDFLENLVYMLGNGVGRARGAKEGNGTQAVMTWRTIAIMTGEEPLMQEYTKGGVSKRTLEIYGAPFDSEEEAAQMHQVCDDNCGWVGPAFVRKLLEHKGTLSEGYQRWLQLVLLAAGASKRAQAASIALLAFADECASKWLWGQDEATARNGAEYMARQILEAVTASDPDSETDRALQFVQGWVTTNWRCFQKSENQPVYGWVVDDEVFVLPNVLRSAMDEAKFSYRKALKEFSLKGIIRKRSDGKFVVSKRHPITKLPANVHAFDKGRLFREKHENYEVIDVDEPLPF